MPKTGVTCVRCDYQFPRAVNPEKCPNCHSIHWDQPRERERHYPTLEIYRCRICGHSWRQWKTSYAPQRCASDSCQSARWNKGG